ncbi:hypothetical protein F66182_1346 [Fusarium sp. NRRL 66182]|nr:hypothetical protein F66182_1346 [Fusarium sp. NRRL 66182]
MNNDQFRKLLAANAENNSAGNKDGALASSSSLAGGNALGSRQRSSIPMTPRAVVGAQADFARQLAERNNAVRPLKKFKSYDPKGVKLASGYVDRSKERDQATDDDRVEKLKELEEQLKNEEIDQETFEKRRFEIAGGDLDSTHLVKGLDFKLLQRIRQGEDIYGETKDEPEQQAAPESELDVDDEFDQLEEQEVQIAPKEKFEVKKKGQLSTASLAPGKKRTRDQILAELKAAREAAKAQQENALGDRFRKISAKQKVGSRIERDSKGREVLIIVDEDGHEKRKVRKFQPGTEVEVDQNGLLMPDKDAKPLGMEVPEQYRKKEEPEEDEDVDIFDGVGDDYDPLAGMDGTDSDSDVDEGSKKKVKQQTPGEDETTNTSMPPPPKPEAPRNYFQGAKTGLVSEEQSKVPSMSDPAIMAAIKRAAALNPIKRDKADSEEDEDDDEDDEDNEARKKSMEERKKKLLQIADRDDEDLDMGFGTSRFADEEDFDDGKVKLSNWGDKDDDGERQSKGGQSKRKRGPKKRKGDANNAADVLRVMEARKKS